MLIDINDFGTFSFSFKKWLEGIEKIICTRLNFEDVSEGEQIEHQLQDLNIFDMPVVKNFVADNPDVEVTGNHVTRLFDQNQVLKEGLVIKGGHGSVAEKRLIRLLEYIGLSKDKINEVFSYIYQYWDRDGEQRTESVHFLIDRNYASNNGMALDFATCLGGEILRWSLDDIDENLYRQEPYKRLWMEGKPYIVKFKCRLVDISESCANQLVAEIIKSYLITQKYGYTYESQFTGMTKGTVPAENVICIEEIEDFVEKMEKNPAYKNFYDVY